MPFSATASSKSTSIGLITPRTDSASISSTPLADDQFRVLADHVGTMRLSEDGPLPPIVGSSSDSSGGVNISEARRNAHSRTPLLSFTPPLANGSKDLSGGPAISDATSSIDGRLCMPEIAVALEDVENPDSYGAFLRSQSPAGSDSPSQRPLSRKRSSSRTNQLPHNVADEELPKERFHDSTFQQAFLRAKQAIFEFTNVLSSGSTSIDPGSTMKQLHEKARNLSRFYCPSTRTVGFVGDSGTGKSSLLNSLLDYPGLARTSSSGRACTCVITEYHYHDTNDFAIEVQRFSMDEIITQLTNLLRSYRLYHLRNTAIDPEGSNNFKEEANVARHTFQAMFTGRFEDEIFLTQLPEETVMETLCSWARELVLPSTDHREVYASREDCGKRLLQLTSEKESTQEPAQWPYIRKVKVFSSAYILSNGLVLADLPGLRDLNLARRTITERYLLECDGIFVICRIGRAATDASVKSVFELAEQAGLSNVGIVCTMSDDIKAEEARKGWSEERANKIQLLLEAIATDQRDFELAEADLEDYEVEDDEKRKDQHEFELKHYLIATRNADVKQTLNDIYQNAVPGNDLKVFCVSNDDYWEHRNSTKDYALSFLQLSGIFTVRKYCISLVARDQLRIARKYVTADIPALLGEVELWVQSGAGSADAERKEQICKTLKTAQARLKKELRRDISHINRIERSFTEVFRDQIYLRRRTNDWSRAAVNTSQEWSDTYSASAYKYFCQHFGDHQTNMLGKHNWNQEAISEMVRDLDAPWQNLEFTLQNRLEQEMESIKVLIDGVIEYIDTELRNSPDTADTLCETMRSQQYLFIIDLEKACEKFQDGLHLLRNDALTGIRTSFIGQLMEESYRKCNAQNGSGSHIERSNIINEKLGDEMTFESHQTSFKNEFRTLAESLQSNIKNAAVKYLSFITYTFDIIRSENVVRESERDAVFRSSVETGLRRVKYEINLSKGVMNS